MCVAGLAPTRSPRRPRVAGRVAADARLHPGRRHRASGIRFTHNNGAFGPQVPAGNARLRRGVPGLRQRRPAGRAAGERHVVAGAAGAKPTPSRLYRKKERAVRRRDAGGRSGSRSVRHGGRGRRLRQRRLAGHVRHARRAEPPFPQHRQGRVHGRHREGRARGRQGFSTSALWFDYDRDGYSICSSATTCGGRRSTTCSAVWTASRSRYCTPEAYRGTTSWLFRNKGDGTFEDVTAKGGLFDATSKSLGVTLLDYDLDGWPDVFVANDTQPNKLYRNNGNGTFTELGLRAGVAFSEDGRARAGMGVDAADFDNAGRSPSASPISPERCWPVPSRRRRPYLRRFPASRRSAGRRGIPWASAASSSTRTSTACRTCSSSTATSTTPSARSGARHIRATAAPVPERRRRAVP